MELSQRRQEVLAPLRERVSRVVPQRLDDKSSLQLAIACAMREPEDIVGFLFPTLVAKLALKSVKELALTTAEWHTLFGGDATPLRDAGLPRLVSTADFRPSRDSIATALRCTVAEQQQGLVWGRPWAQALCYVAMHLEEPDARIESVLGTVVRSDTRRVEELHARMDEDGYDIMLMAQTMMALSECVL